MDSATSVQRIKNVTLAACAIAAGDIFIRAVEEKNWLSFEIAVPAMLDLADPTTHVPIGPLLMWVDLLAGKVSERRRKGVQR